MITRSRRTPPDERVSRASRSQDLLIVVPRWAIVRTVAATAMLVAGALSLRSLAQPRSPERR